MAIASMTGFGRSSGTVGAFTVTVEMKSVNHRFAEYAIRTPREWSFLEEDIRRRLGASISRGRVDVFVNVQRAEQAARSVEVNWPLLDSLVEAERRAMSRYQAQFENSNVRNWLMYPEVLSATENLVDEDMLRRGIGELVEQAIDQLASMRTNEGQRLADNCADKIRALTQWSGVVRNLDVSALHVKRETLERRIRDLGIALDEQRLAQEIVLLVDRSAVDEEVVRLGSHIESFQTALRGSGPIGRRLDFIVQEMHREVNTIGSKTTDSEMSRAVVDMKVLVEQLREQVQNIE